MAIIQQEEKGGITRQIAFHDAESVFWNKFTEILNLIGFVTAMIIYVSYFTILRFKREAFEQEQYEKIINLNFGDKVLAHEMRDIIQNNKLDKELLQGDATGHAIRTH